MDGTYVKIKGKCYYLYRAVDSNGNIIDEQAQHSPGQYLNNIRESHHRFIKWIIKPMMGFFSFKTANWLIQGIEAMHMIKKVQIKHYFRDYKMTKFL